MCQMTTLALKNLLELCTDINGSGGYSYEYIQKFLGNWD